MRISGGKLGLVAIRKSLLVSDRLVLNKFLTATTSFELKLNRKTLTQANYRHSGLGYGPTYFVNRKQDYQEIHVPSPNEIICAVNRTDAFPVGNVSLISSLKLSVLS